MENDNEENAGLFVCIFTGQNGIGYRWKNVNLSIEEISRFLENHGGVLQLSRKMLFFPTGKGNLRVHPKKIVYADTCKSCTTVHLADNREFTGICSLTDMQKYLSDKGFLRIHKSYLVNMKYVTGFYGNVILLQGNIEFTIGRDYRKDVKAHIDLVGSKSRSYL